MTELTHFIRYYDNVITPEQCRHYIKCIDEGEQKVGQVSSLNPKHTVRPNLKVSLDVNFSDQYPEEANEIVEIVNRYIPIYHKDVGYTTPSIATESVTGRLYKENEGFYKPHVDRGNALCIDRVLSILLYLSEVEGGDLVFPKLKHSIHPEPGRLVFFPSEWMYLHGANMSTKGDRYGIRIFTLGSNHDIKYNTLEYDRLERERRAQQNRDFETINL